MKVFVDTWAWLSLIDKREKEHMQVVNRYGQLLRNHATLYTTDYILDETNTLLFKRLSFGIAKQGLSGILESISFGQLVLELITPLRFQLAYDLRLRFQDKPDISFTDLTSMAVMQELGITQILTADAHFQHVGLGFQFIPER